MNDREPENDQLPLDWFVPLDQRTLEIRMAEYSGEDLAESRGFSQVLERTKQMPHFSAARSGWENVCANLQYIQISFARLFSSVRLPTAVKPRGRGRPKADPDGDFELLSAWMHCGIWLLSHEDRALCMQLLFRHETPLTDALRKRCQRLGLLGWNDFPKTYHQAPFAYSECEGEVGFRIAPCWKHLLTCSKGGQ